MLDTSVFKDLPGTPVKGLEIASLRPTLAEIERILEWIAADLMGMDLILVPVIQTYGTKKNCLGHFAPERWSTKEGEYRAELQISAEFLSRPTLEIVETLVHESVHAWNYSRSVKDCSKSDYHNKKFAAAAEEAGLMVNEPKDSKGWTYTQLGMDLEERIIKELKPDHSAFQLFRRSPVKKEKPTNKTVAYECECGFKVRVASGISFQAKCDVCGGQFGSDEGGK